jgi:hypothetical protein
MRTASIAFLTFAIVLHSLVFAELTPDEPPLSDEEKIELRRYLPTESDEERLARFQAQEVLRIKTPYPDGAVPVEYQPEGNVWDYAISPTREFEVFLMMSSEYLEINNKLVIVDNNGTKVSEVASVGGSASIVDFCISPDAKHIAFYQDAIGKDLKREAYEFYIHELSSSKTIKLSGIEELDIFKYKDFKFIDSSSLVLVGFGLEKKEEGYDKGLYLKRYEISTIDDIQSTDKIVSSPTHLLREKEEFEQYKIIPSSNSILCSTIDFAIKENAYSGQSQLVAYDIHTNEFSKVIGSEKSYSFKMQVGGFGKNVLIRDRMFAHKKADFNFLIESVYISPQSDPSKVKYINRHVLYPQILFYDDSKELVYFRAGQGGEYVNSEKTGFRDLDVFMMPLKEFAEWKI